MTDKDKALDYLYKAYTAVKKLRNNKRAGWDREIRQIAEDIRIIG